MTTVRFTISMTVLLAVCMVLPAPTLWAQCSPDSLQQRSIKANDTDPNISWELANHQVFINTDCPGSTLLIHLVGTFDNPASTTYFPTLAANNGFRVINLKYENGQSATGTCGNDPNLSCFDDFHQELVYGTDVNGTINSDSNHSINNRLEKLLHYLHAQYPTENWDDYLTVGGAVNWNLLWLSGHSQGGGHAAWIGKKEAVQRVITFASPNEYSTTFNAPADWLDDPGLTPDTNYYAFGNQFDDVAPFSEQMLAWGELGFLALGDTVLAESSVCRFEETHVLYTKITTGSGAANTHSNMIVDSRVPLVSGEPIWLEAWGYLLDLCQDPNGIESNLDQNSVSVKAWPNPAVEQVTIAAQKPIVEIVIYDVTGKEVRRIAPNETQFSVPILEKGLHLYQITLVSGETVCRRVIHQ